MDHDAIRKAYPDVVTIDDEVDPSKSRVAMLPPVPTTDPL